MWRRPSVFLLLALAASSAAYHDSRPSLARLLADAALADRPAAASGEAPATSGTPPPLVAAAGGYPCLRDGRGNQKWWCIDVKVPLNHTEPSDERTINVVFQVLPASGLRRGSLLMAQGGPGVVSHTRAKVIAARLPHDIRESFDLVLVDQRGVGWSCGLWCPEASFSYALKAADATGRDAQVTAARDFAEQCISGLEKASREPRCSVKPEEILAHSGTQQAAEDIEAFANVALAPGEKLWLYGRSYGTQLVQHYASKHPERVAVLVLDSPVDVAIPLEEYYTEGLESLRNATEALEKWCGTQAECARDMCPEGAQHCLGSLSRLLSSLRSGKSHAVSFPLHTGKISVRKISSWHIEHAAAQLLYSRMERGLLLRAISAYARDGRLLPLLRWFYATIGVDGSTLDKINVTGEDPFSSASFNVIDASDYDFQGSTGAEARAKGFLDATEHLRDTDFESLALERLPYAFFRPDALQGSGRIPYLSDFDFPVLVLTSDIDPATPHLQGLRIAQHTKNGHVVVQQGGEHSMYLTSGFTCVDNIVTSFLLNETSLAPGGRTDCPAAEPTTGYAPISLPHASKYQSAIDIAVAFDEELHSLPEIVMRPMGSQTAKLSVKIGCDFGGTLVAEDSGSTVVWNFDSCSLIKGTAITGEGVEDKDGLYVNATISGYWSGSFQYNRDRSNAQLGGTLPQSRRDKVAVVVAALSVAVGGTALVMLLGIVVLLLKQRVSSSYRQKLLT